MRGDKLWINQRSSFVLFREWLFWAHDDQSRTPRMYRRESRPESLFPEVTCKASVRFAIRLPLAQVFCERLLLKFALGFWQKCFKPCE